MGGVPAPQPILKLSRLVGWVGLSVCTSGVKRSGFRRSGTYQRTSA
jgi:hypothetical protein